MIAKSRVRVDAALREALAFLKEHVVQGPDRVVHCAFRKLLPCVLRCIL